MDTAGLLGPKYKWRQAAWSAVPAHLRPGLVRYVDDGVPTGAGLRGLIANGQVFDVLKQLDDTTLPCALDIMKFLYSEAPSACWGSEEAVRRWEALGGYRNHATGRRTITTTVRILDKDVVVQFERRGRNVFVHPSHLTEANRLWAQAQIAARELTDD
jgi:hypothetical protein